MAAFIQDELRNYHTQQINQGSDNTMHTMEIVEIIGGIDQIISTYLLQQNQNILTNNQFSDIYQLISAQEDIQTHGNTLSLDFLELLSTAKEQQLIHEFSKNDTALHRYFGTFGRNCFNLFHNKTTLVILAIFGFTSCVSFWVWWGSGKFKNAFEITKTIFDLILVVFFVICLLLVNLKALKLILKSFEFWFKMFYVLRYAICNLAVDIWSDYWVPNEILEDTLHPILLVLVFSIFDGYQFNVWIKFSLGVGTSIYVSWIAYSYTIDAFELPYIIDSPLGTRFDKNIELPNDANISLRQLMASSLQVISIFLWKQTIFSVLRKDRCVLITHHPFIRWIDGHVNNNKKKNCNDNKLGTIEIDLQNVKHNDYQILTG